VVDKKRVIGKNGGLRRRRRGTRDCCPPQKKPLLLLEPTVKAPIELCWNLFQLLLVVNRKLPQFANFPTIFY
jgi:hypothetical protein